MVDNKEEDLTYQVFNYMKNFWKVQEGSFYNNFKSVNDKEESDIFFLKA